jgi:hypothetical protein
MDDAILSQTLEELEDGRWGPPTYDSYLVRTAHRLRTVPLKDLTVEDLRLLLGQQIGTAWLMPLALERLRVDALTMGDFYPGDLLSSVLNTQAAYWDQHPDQLAALRDIRTALQEHGGTDLLADDRWPS